MQNEIKSRNNERFKALVEAKKDKGLLMLEGRRLTDDALSRGYEPIHSAVTLSYIELHGTPKFESIILSEDLFFKLTETQTPQGIIVFIRRPYKTIGALKGHDRLVILDGLQDPGNVGTIVRTAEAFGFSGIIVTPGTASPFSEKAVRASMGSVLGIDIAEAGSGEIGLLDHEIISLVLKGGEPVRHDMFAGRFALCLGQEGSGLSADMLVLPGRKVFIQMKGRTESLNVAVAAGIVMAIAAGVAN
jgi:RNA methyltransferase, TrmH family